MTQEQPVVFVIDDDGMVRDAVKDLLRSVGLSVESFGSAQDFLQSKRSDAPGCIVLDVRLPGASGLEFQRTLVALGIPLPVLFISGRGDISMSVRAIHTCCRTAGAFRLLDITRARSLRARRHRTSKQADCTSTRVERDDSEGPSQPHVTQDASEVFGRDGANGR